MNKFIRILIFTLLVTTIGYSQQIKLWGLTSEETEDGMPTGNVFSITSNGEYTNIHSFDNVEGGYRPVGTLTLGDDGFLYGMTELGGALPFQYGVIFKIDVDGTYTKLHDCVETGYGPVGWLTIGSDNDFYGLAGGGSNSKGVIFKYSNENGFKKLFDFAKDNGTQPFGSLIVDEEGDFYGMTSDQNYSDRYGTIFGFTKDGSYIKLYDFDGGLNGSRAVGSLVLGNDGRLYGMTQWGGSYGKGVIFAITKDRVYTKLHDFNGTSGAYPLGSLTLSDDGVLYGMTTSGGNSNEGVIFSITDNGTYRTLYNFKSDSGSKPRGKLLLATNGVFYGTTSLGGEYNQGVVFSLTKVGVYTKIHDFDGVSGGLPYGSLIEYTPSSLDTKEVIIDEGEFVVYPNPSNGKFVVELEEGGEKIISVRDMNGRVVKKFSTVENDQCEVELNVDKGIYILSVRAAHRVQDYKVIIK